MTAYASDVLVSADWVRSRLSAFRDDDPSYRLVEVDVDPRVYEDGHVPGAVTFDWKRELQDSLRFDVASRGAFERMVGDAGIATDSTVVLYGDVMNWFAAYAYWLFSYYGHTELYLLDGGRDYWVEQEGPLTDETPSFTRREYETDPPDASIRIDRPELEGALDTGTRIVDVRSPQEFRGEILAPPGWNEGVQRGGHVPGAVNVPWSRTVRPDGRFRPAEELEALFEDEGVRDEETVVYCRIGERSALVWVALHELLGYDDVRHYYGSWVEWGNTVGAPIERGG
ncbi:sulfurtransferase [Natronorarus salvus]|uniref:sulfurtransferase n=1 Tax=Natronorarus salvus TaxID=3117733 RepID=UPI002F26212A